MPYLPVVALHADLLLSQALDLLHHSIFRAALRTEDTSTGPTVILGRKHAKACVAQQAVLDISQQQPPCKEPKVQ
jgi:alpha-D-ribose 1-methylphosphonate 5-triphosphate synthase subunit PhnG